MAVSKRVRFEVLRRDNNACQYCGQVAPDVPLTIDHVIPVALGGSDDPSNLVTACRDCNAGKTSIPPDSPFVKQVSDRASAYALGLLDKMTRLRADLEREETWCEEFLDLWNAWHFTGSSRDGQHIPLPTGWQKSVVRWHSIGIPRQLFEKAIRLAMEKKNLHGDDAVFAYMAGVIWRTVDALEVDYTGTPEHAAVYTEMEARALAADQGSEAWDKALRVGWQRGFDQAYALYADQHPYDDELVELIDGRAVDRGA